MAIRIKARSGESAEAMLRRFKKLCDKEGLTKEVKKRQYYEKPSERKQRAARKAEKRREMIRLGIPIGGPRSDRNDSNGYGGGSGGGGGGGGRR